MKKDDSFINPISSIFMLLAFSPYVIMRYGYMFIFVLGVFIGIYLYRFYTDLAFKENISFIEAIERDLPDMSPLHFVFFIFIATPVLLIFAGGDSRGLYGIALAWVIYTIYYYGFKK